MFRPMRRHAQQLDHATCEELLRTQKRGVLAVLGDDEYPYAVPLNYVYLDGALYFHSAVEGHKLDAVTAHPKASFCVHDDGVLEEGSWWYHVRSVIAFGRVERVTDEDEVIRALRRLGKKYFPPTEDIDADIARNLRRVAVLKLSVEHLSGKHVREN